MVKWPFKNRRPQQHGAASSAHAGGANAYHAHEYSYDVVQAPYPGWPGPPYPGGHSTTATFQTSSVAQSPSSPSYHRAHDGFARFQYPASSTAYTPSPTTPSHPTHGAYADTDRWRDTSAPAPKSAPSLEYTGSDKPTPEDLRRALFIPRFSPPPSHWRALIPLDPVPDANGFYTPPINRLPVELLSYIFTRCMDDEVKNPFYASFSAGFTPLVIARVCRLWRAISLDLPFLWQRFAMRPCQRRGHYRIARLFLERTKGLGIYVHYSEDSRRGAFPRELCPCALDFVLHNIGQVKALNLVQISSSTLLRLSRVRPGAASSMVKLVVTAREEDTAMNVPHALSSLYQAPTFREIDWALPFFPENIHWTRIVSVRLCECRLDTFTVLRIITSCPLLRHLDVDITPAEHPLRYNLLSHRVLEDLIIQGDGPQDILLEALDLPNLRRLYIRPGSSIPDDASYSQGWPFLDVRALYHFLGRLRAGLEYFLLLYGGAAFDEAALLHIIGMPQLATLKMLNIAELGGGVSDTVLKALTVVKGRGTALPQLERLAMCDCSTTDGCISRMLQSRYRAACPLRRVSLGYPMGEQRGHDMDVATMEMLRQKGWTIFWTSCFGD